MGCPPTGPRIVIMVGLPGAGKTSVSSFLAARLGYQMMSRDALKRALFGTNDVGEKQNNLSFRLMKEALPLACELSPGVILDGMPFSRPGQVESVIEVAEAIGAEVQPLFFKCPPEVAAMRLQSDESNGPSDRTAELVWRVERDFRPIPSGWTVLDASQALTEVQQQALSLLTSERGL